MTKRSRREELLFHTTGHDVSNRNSIFNVFYIRFLNIALWWPDQHLFSVLLKFLCLWFQVQTGSCCVSPAATVRTRFSRSGGHIAPTTKTSYKDWRQWVRSVAMLTSVMWWKSEHECIRIAMKAVIVRRVPHRINVSFRHPEFLSGAQTVSPRC